jgi:hypothetical protein
LLFGGVAILGGWGLFFAVIGGVGQLLNRFWLGKATEHKHHRRWQDADGHHSEEWTEKQYKNSLGHRIALGMMIAGYGLAVIIAFARVPSPAKLAQMRMSAPAPARPTWPALPQAPQAQIAAPVPRVPQSPSEAIINLRGEDVLSDDVFDVNAYPPTWKCRWYGPPWHQGPL